MVIQGSEWGPPDPGVPTPKKFIRFSCLKPGATEIWFPRERTLTTIRPNSGRTYLLDVLWGQPIKLIQVVSTSEFHEY